MARTRPLVSSFLLALPAAAQGLVLDIQLSSPPQAEGWYPEQFVEFGGRTLFLATHPTAGPELFVSDGTSAGTVLLRDV
jgi:hypothetical protein